MILQFSGQAQSSLAFVNILNDENNFNSKLNIYKIKNDFSEIIPHKKIQL